MKKFFLVAALVSGVFLLSSFYDNSPVNQKVLKSFHSDFGYPDNARWSENPGDDYVSFIQNNVMVRADYDRHGDLLYSLRYFDAQLLPEDVLSSITGQFPDEKINVVTEVTTPAGKAYVIQLEDGNGWTILNSDMDGNLTITDKFNKE
jgi:hypothetical protein